MKSRHRPDTTPARRSHIYNPTSGDRILAGLLVFVIFFLRVHTACVHAWVSMCVLFPLFFACSRATRRVRPSVRGRLGVGPFGKTIDLGHLYGLKSNESDSLRNDRGLLSWGGIYLYGFRFRFKFRFKFRFRFSFRFLYIYLYFYIFIFFTPL